MREARRRMDEGHAVPGEREAAQERGAGRERLDRGADVVLEAGSVSSSVRSPPPNVDWASRTTTEEAGTRRA
jgi:hypothetical protein